MKHTDIHLNKRSYRGVNNFTVNWKSDGFPDQQDFDSEALALQFMRELEADSKAQDWQATTESLLAKLEMAPAELNKFLLDLTTKAKNGFGKWQEYAEQSIQLRIKLSQLAVKQSTTAENYLEKLEAFSDTPLDEVIAVYEEHTKHQKVTKEILEAYVERLNLEEADEDEVEFIERKLTRFLDSFSFNILAIEDEDILEYIRMQKGSESAKSRLKEIILEFNEFASRALSPVSH